MHLLREVTRDCMDQLGSFDQNKEEVQETFYDHEVSWTINLRLQGHIMAKKKAWRCGTHILAADAL
jgi:hypothetical protein